MFKITLLMMIFMPMLSFAQSPQSAIAPQLASLAKQVKQFDANYKNIRTFGKERTNRFFTNYFSRFYNENARGMRLVEFLSSYDSDAISPVINYREAQKFYAEFLPFIAQSNIVYISIDFEKEPFLYRTAFEYSIGFLFNLSSMARRDIEHREKLLLMRAEIVNRMTYFFNASGVGVLSLDDWENIYFPLALAYHSNYDAYLVEKASQNLFRGNASKDENFSKATSTLLAELAILCRSRCIQEKVPGDTWTQPSLEDSKKSIFRLCEMNCKLSNLILANIGFYRSYESILQETNDPKYKSIKEKEAAAYVYGYLLNMENSVTLTGPTGVKLYWYMSKHFIENLVNFLVAILKYLFFYSRLWLIFVFSSILICTFKGLQNFSIAQTKNPPYTRMPHGKRGIKQNISVAISEIKLIPKYSFLITKIFIRNIFLSFINPNNEILYKIASNSLVVGATLWLSDLVNTVEL